MLPTLHISVAGGTTHRVPLDSLQALQLLVQEYGAETHPLFLRLGATLRVEVQPVTARALLAEVEAFTPLIAGRPMPGLSFRDESGCELGGILGGPAGRTVASTNQATLSVTADGIRLLVRHFPPPVGFRSHPELERGQHECYFAALYHTPEGTSGLRTAGMGGSGAPVALPGLPDLPPPTRWDFARVASGTAVAVTRFVETPAEVVFRDLLHALTSACNESLRLKKPLRAVRE